MYIPLEIKFILGIVSSVLALSFSVPYIIDILKKKTEPHMYSWLIWTILQVVASVAHFSDGGGYGSWAIAVGAVMCFVIFLLSIKFGTKNISKFDLLCLILALISVVVYFLIKSPLLTVFIVVFADTIAFLPTMRKGYEEPGSETQSAYFLSSSSNLLSIFAIQNYSIITVLYSAILFITNFAMLLILKFSPNHKK